MFYVKEKVAENADLIIELTDENIYCQCPTCGAEVLVDLAEVLSDRDSDLFSVSVCCAECSQKIKEGEIHA